MTEINISFETFVIHLLLVKKKKSFFRQEEKVDEWRIFSSVRSHCGVWAEAGQSNRIPIVCRCCCCSRWPPPPPEDQSGVFPPLDVLPARAGGGGLGFFPRFCCRWSSADRLIEARALVAVITLCAHISICIVFFPLFCVPGAAAGRSTPLSIRRQLDAQSVWIGFFSSFFMLLVVVFSLVGLFLLLLAVCRIGAGGGGAFVPYDPRSTNRPIETTVDPTIDDTHVAIDWLSHTISGAITLSWTTILASLLFPLRWRPPHPQRFPSVLAAMFFLLKSNGFKWFVLDKCTNVEMISQDDCHGQAMPNDSVVLLVGPRSLCSVDHLHPQEILLQRVAHWKYSPPCKALFAVEAKRFGVEIFPVFSPNHHAFHTLYLRKKILSCCHIADNCFFSSKLGQQNEPKWAPSGDFSTPPVLLPRYGCPGSASSSPHGYSALSTRPENSRSNRYAYHSVIAIFQPFFCMLNTNFSTDEKQIIYASNDIGNACNFTYQDRIFSKFAKLVLVENGL